MNVRIIPKTKKMRERVKAHGDVWELLRYDTLLAASLIATISVVHYGQYPYMRWVRQDDCDIVPVHKSPY